MQTCRPGGTPAGCARTQPDCERRQLLHRLPLPPTLWRKCVHHLHASAASFAGSDDACADLSLISTVVPQWSSLHKARKQSHTSEMRIEECSREVFGCRACRRGSRCSQGRLPARRLVGGRRSDGVLDCQPGRAARRRSEALLHGPGASQGQDGPTMLLLSCLQRTSNLA